MFHELSNVMGAVHNLAFMRTAHASGDVSSTELNAVMDMAHSDIMSLLHATSDFRRDFNANARMAVEQQGRGRVRQVRNRRRGIDPVQLARFRETATHVYSEAEGLRRVSETPAPVTERLDALDAIINAQIAAQRTAQRQADHQRQVNSYRVFRPRTPSNSPPPRRVPAAARVAAPKTKAIKQSEMDAVMPDVCGICIDEYTRANSVLTCCGHSFCMSCYTNAAQHAATNPDRTKRKMKCPMCRKESPKLTIYRARKAPVRRVLAVAVAGAAPETEAQAEANVVVVA